MQGGEPLTRQVSTYCDSTGGQSANGWPMRSTIWYLVEGTGRTLSLSSFGPGVDSVMAVYAIRSNKLALVKCNDDVFDDDDTRWSAVRIASRPASCMSSRSAASARRWRARRPLGEGTLFTDVATQPADDDVTQATVISLDEQNTESLAGATEADGELLACDDAPYGKTRWFRVKVPSVGTLTVTATSPSTTASSGSTRTTVARGSAATTTAAGPPRPLA